MSSTEHLEGIWQATSAVVNGEEMPADAVRTIQLILTATRFTTRRGGQTLFDSSYSVNAAKVPNEIEMIGIEDFAGKPALGEQLFPTCDLDFDGDLVLVDEFDGAP